MFSNTQTLLPALYGRTPRPDVRPRFQPKPLPEPMPTGNILADMMAVAQYQAQQAQIQIAKDGATVIERCLTYSLSEYDFDSTMTAVVTDYLLTGRGVSRITYEPTLGPDGSVADEKLRCELVHWDDLRIWPARSWAEVPAIAFRHLLTREQLVERFGELGASIPLSETVASEDDDAIGDGQSESSDKTSGTYKRGLVWEIWDKTAYQVVFIAPSLKTDKPILQAPDPYGLKGFFPIPAPLYSVPDTSSMVPQPEYLLYEDQADEIDVLTRRINATIKAIKHRGWYNANSEEVGTLLTSADNKMVAVQSAGMTEDISKLIAFVPIAPAVQALQALYEGREQAKQVVYEVTGLSDILRGSSMASETATAQDIKSRWGALRIQNRRREIERMAVEIVRMKAEIMASMYDPVTLEAMSGIPISMELLTFLRSDGLRNYRIDIETDSTVQPDRQQDQEAVKAAFDAITGTFVAMGMPMPPEVGKPLAIAAVKTLPSAGRELEDALNQWQPMAVAPMLGTQPAQMGAGMMTSPPSSPQPPNLQVIEGGMPQPNLSPA